MNKDQFIYFTDKFDCRFLAKEIPQTYQDINYIIQEKLLQANNQTKNPRGKKRSVSNNIMQNWLQKKRAIEIILNEIKSRESFTETSVAPR